MPKKESKTKLNSLCEFSEKDLDLMNEIMDQVPTITEYRKGVINKIQTATKESEIPAEQQALFVILLNELNKNK